MSVPSAARESSVVTEGRRTHRHTRIYTYKHGHPYTHMYIQIVPSPVYWSDRIPTQEEDEEVGEAGVLVS